MPNRRNPAAGTGGESPPVSTLLHRQVQRMKASEVLRRVYERVISLVTRIDSDTMEMYSAITALGFALCMLSPGEYLTGPEASPRMAPMARMAPEVAWGVFFLVGAVWQIATIVGAGLTDPPGRAWSVMRLGGQCVAFGVWTFLAILLGGGTGFGMGVWMFGWMAVFILPGLVKSAFAFRVALEYRGYKRMQEAGKELPPAPPPRVRQAGGGGAAEAGAGTPPPPGPAEYLRIGFRLARGILLHEVPGRKQQPQQQQAKDGGGGQRTA